MSDYEHDRVYRYDATTNTFDQLSPHDCYGRALPGEPRFTLLARDPDFYRLVTKWAKKRGRDIACGDRPIGDSVLVADANATAHNGAVWRRENMGKWRK